MIIRPETTPRREREFKQMLSTRRLEDGRWHVAINYSSMACVQTCMRKSEYKLRRGLVAQTEAPALQFGKGFHKAMEVLYVSPKFSWSVGSAICDESEDLMLYGHPPATHGPCARCAAKFAFLTETPDLPAENDARSRKNGLVILDHYVDTYLHDPYELLCDDQGPICERSASLILYEDETKVIEYFGTIDSVLRNRETKEIVLCDHKTTSSLGKDFFNRIRPNFQYVGYWLLAKEVLDLNPARFMVNGVQVAKTKQDVNRQFTSINDDEISEFVAAVIYQTEKFLRGVETDVWPQSAPDACTQWGGCEYRHICELPKKLRESVIEAEYGKKEII